MSDSEKDAVDQLIDLLVYAPLGLALEYRTLLPELAERGRRQLDFARSIGKLAVGGLVSQADRTGKSSTAQPEPSSDADKPAAKKPPSAKKLDANACDDVDAVLPTYETLTARNIVSRLDTLTPNQLRTVATHERDNRKRATVLNRIEQLLA